MFLLRKIIARTLFPVPLVLEIVLLGALLLKWKRTWRWGVRLVVLAMVLLYSFSLPIVGDALLRPLERQYPPLNVTVLVDRAGDDSTKQISDSTAGGLIAGVSSQNLPSPVYGTNAFVIGVAGTSFSEDRGFGSEHLIRLQEAGRIAAAMEKAGMDYQLVVSVPGDVATSVKRYAVERYFSSFGIPADRIGLVLHARSSADEVAAFCDHPGQLVLVSSAFHMPRLMELAHNRKREALPAPAGYLADSGHFTVLALIPSADALAKTRIAIYENLGMLVAR